MSTIKEYTHWRQFLAWVGFTTLFVLLPTALVLSAFFGTRYLAHDAEQRDMLRVCLQNASMVDQTLTELEQQNNDCYRAYDYGVITYITT